MALYFRDRMKLWRMSGKEVNDVETAGTRMILLSQRNRIKEPGVHTHSILPHHRHTLAGPQGGGGEVTLDKWPSLSKS